MAYCVNEREEEIVPTVDELIENGYIVKKACIKDGYGASCIL